MRKLLIILLLYSCTGPTSNPAPPVDTLAKTTALSAKDASQDKLIQALFDKNTSQDKVHSDLIAANGAQDKLITSQRITIIKLIADTVYLGKQIKSLAALNKSMTDSVNQLAAKNVSFENLVTTFQTHLQSTDAGLGQVNAMILNTVSKDSVVTLIGTPGRIKIRTITSKTFQLDIDSTYRYN